MNHQAKTAGNSGIFSCSGDCAHCVQGVSYPGAEWKTVDAVVVGAISCGPADGLILRHNGYQIRFARMLSVEDLNSREADENRVIVNVVDSSDLEGSLLTTARLLDMGEKMVVTLGHYDRLLKTDHSVDYNTLGTLLGVSVMPVDFESGEGLGTFADAVAEAYAGAPTAKKVPLLRESSIEESRVAFVSGALQETLVHSRDRSDHTLTQRIDAVLTGKWTGFPLLVLILLGVFEATFTLGAYPQGWIENGMTMLGNLLRDRMAPGWLTSMLVDGVVQGVGAVLAFLPNIVILFFFLSLLEDCGYMARAAFIMDKMMHRIGLHGKSFVPMLIGFGCNVPAIMAARSISDRRDRTLTMLMIPFMSCSARLPVYMLFVSVFFARSKALVMMGIYAIGIVLSILFAFVMKRTKYFRKADDDFVSELPPYRRPGIRATGRHIWANVSDYLRKISTVILAASVVIWALEYFPVHRTDYGQDKEESYLADIGKAISPVLEPLGFDWKMSVCILTGLPAKEAIVSTMGILYHADEGDGSLVGTMRDEVYVSGPKAGLNVFNPAVAWSFMLFVLLYFPCIATIATLRREIGRRWAAFTVVHSLCLAWAVAFIAYRLVLLF